MAASTPRLALLPVTAALLAPAPAFVGDGTFTLVPGPPPGVGVPRARSRSSIGHDESLASG